MRYFVGFFITIGLIIVAFVLIFSIVRNNGDDSSTDVTQMTELSSYANSTKVARLTIDGTISSEETHRAVQINVGQNQTTGNVIGGYNGTVIKSSSTPNNQQSYEVFLNALERAGFDKGDSDPALGDERGACPTGRRYILEIWDDSTRVSHLWTTSCGGGTFDGSIDNVLTLFRRQVPDYNVLTSGVALS